MNGILDIDLKSLGIAKVLQQYRLRVPPYQRPYAWRDEHVNQLFDDLADAYTTKGKINHYFLGTIVLNRTSEHDLYEVSDGQQRLATTSIFIAAIRDLLEKGNKSERTTSDKYTRNFLIEFEELVGDWAPKLQLNTQDHGYFRDAILVPPSSREQQPGIEERSSNERLARAYELAHKRAQILMGAVSDQFRVRLLYEWVNYLTNNVAVVVITVPEDVDGYTMFETLNDRGLRASQVDNIKNRLFRGAGARLKEVEELWLSMMAQVESFGNDETVLSYLRHYWISENGPTKEKELAKQFRAHISGQSEVASFVKKLDDYAVDYEALFFAPLEHIRLHNYTATTRGYIAAISRVLGIEQIRPLMMAVLRTLTPVEAQKAFQLMLSWSVRFIIVGTGGGGYLDRNYSLLAAKVSPKGISKARELRDEFSNSVPADPEFEAAFRSHSISNSEIARYVCRSLEAHKRGEPHPSVAFFENTQSSNLEHVLPRIPGPDWKIAPDVAKAYFKRIGNLALLDPRANVEIGNVGFSGKQRYYAKSPFLITQELSQITTDWGPEQIEERQRKLASYAASVWPLTWK
jgi:hypothetical protein